MCAEKQGPAVKDWESLLEKNIWSFIKFPPIIEAPLDLMKTRINTNVGYYSIILNLSVEFVLDIHILHSIT